MEIRKNHKYDVLILNRILPDINGIEICKRVKNKYVIPVIILSEESGEKGLIEGFQAGADDYVTKPFSPREFVLRIQSILRRVTESAPFDFKARPGSELLISDILIRFATHKVYVKQKEIHLTPKEYDLFHFLAKHQGKAFSRKELLAKVWNNSQAEIHNHRTVDAHVKRLRVSQSLIKEQFSLMRMVRNRI